MEEIGTTSIGFSSELVIGFIFFAAEEFDAADAFLFFTTARSAALVFFTSVADGRIGVGVGAGGAEGFGSITSGTTDAVALISSVSSGAWLPWQFLQRLEFSHQPWNSHFLQSAEQMLQPEDFLVALGLQHWK